MPACFGQVRAGTGGDEACLFAMDLFRMYERYAATKGWKFEVGGRVVGGAGGRADVWAGVRLLRRAGFRWGGRHRLC